MEPVKVKEFFVNKNRSELHDDAALLHAALEMNGKRKLLIQVGRPVYMIKKTAEVYYRSAEDLVIIKSTEDMLDRRYEPGKAPRMVTSIAFKLDRGKKESSLTELDFFLSFLSKVEPKCKIKGMSDKQKDMFMPQDNVPEQKRDAYYLSHVTYYQDFYRTYVHYVTKKPQSKKEFRKTIRDVKDLPKFLKEELEWKNSSMLEDAIIFFVFNKRCGNDNCDNFSNLKCSDCMMENYCSIECQELEARGHYKHCCEYNIRRGGARLRRQLPRVIFEYMQIINAVEDLVSVETFCRELCRKICLHFMEALENTKLMTFMLEERKLQVYYSMKSGGGRERIGSRKYEYTKAKLHTVLDDYKEPPISMTELRKQMEDVYGAENNLSLAMRHQEHMQDQVEQLLRLSLDA